MALQEQDNLPVLVEDDVFLEYLAEEIERSKRYRHTFTVLLLQPPKVADELKSLTLEWLKSLTRGLVRGCDVVAIFQSEATVAVLLPETGVSGAGALLDRIRSAVADTSDEWEYTLLEYPTNRRMVESFMDQAA